MRTILYIVPTPIGNFDDITFRALKILKQVELIAAEDTRRTGILLQHFFIKTPMLSFHNYNEKQRTQQLILKLQSGLNIALVSNAGTPLINDPGYTLVKYCHKLGIKVIPLPGACAAITALSASGITTNRFCYEGFIPKNNNDRKKILNKLYFETRTLIFYESCYRLLDTLIDIINILGSERYVVLAKEITKKWEFIYGLPVGKLLEWIKEDNNRYRGELVLIIEGYQDKIKTQNFEIISPYILKQLTIILQYLPFKKAIVLTSKLFGLKNKILYKYIIEKTNIHCKYKL